ncbi:MAG: glycoside hydrolase family 28 protein, partial [Flavisolibacter sp.]|nr:glycoside hydrolase family 28 protein [Flavisolibacter sp.]
MIRLLCYTKKVFLLLAIFISIGITAFAQNKKLPIVQATNFKKDSFNILRYGAKPDGITLNTKSITDAIEDCNKKGGGIVVVPAGVWLTG